MFRERIDNTPFTSEEANYHFSSIKNTNTPYAGDLSMLATLRVMFGDRLGDDGAIGITYRNFELSKNDAERFDDSRVLNSVVGSMVEYPHTLTVVEAVNNETAGRVMGVMRDGFVDGFPGWESVPKVEAFFMKAFPVQCFINRELQSAILLTDRLTLRKWHYIQVALFHCFPWFFTESPLNDEDKKLIRSLSEETPGTYLAILAEKATKYDFEKIRIERLLNGFETGFERRRIESLKSEMDSKRRDIENYNDCISRMLAELREYNYKIIGLQEVIDSHAGESLLMDYFLADRKLGLENASEGEMRFTVKGFVENYNEDEVEARLNNTNSFVYDRYGDERINQDDMVRLLRSIFLDHEIKLRTCAAYVFSAGGDRIRVTPQEDKRYPAEFSTYMPNPHIQQYGCMGSYKQIINQQLLDGDYVGAIVQCEVSCNSLNWCDQTVMCAFMRTMYRTTNACFELPDGKCVDQVEAVKWLKEKEA